MKIWKIGLILTMALVMSCKQNSGGPITMNLYYTGENGNARLFVEEMESSGTADAIRAEEGNLRYDYFFSASDPETVLLIDSWASQEAIDSHHATPMMQTIAALREKYDLHMSAERYFRADEDLTTKDQSFIRQ
jgi:quinol monooxygenase YgiN